MENIFDKIYNVFDSGINGAIVVLPIIIGTVLFVIGIRLLFKELGSHKIRVTAKCMVINYIEYIKL